MGERKHIIEKEFVINKEIELHVRPASQFTKVASSYKSEIRVIKGDKSGNGKSLLSLLALGIFGGTKFTVKIVGPDEVEAMNGITRLIESNFKDA